MAAAVTGVVVALAAVAVVVVMAADPRTQNFAAGGLSNGDRVHATGTLELLDAEQAVKRLPGPSLLPSRFQGFERQPILIARRVEQVPPGGRVRPLP